MSEALTTIEKRITDLQQFCQERANFLNQIDLNIKQLKLERLNVLKQLSEVQGAIQGFTEAVKLIKGETTVVPVIQPVEEVSTVADVCAVPVEQVAAVESENVIPAVTVE